MSGNIYEDSARDSAKKLFGDKEAVLSELFLIDKVYEENSLEQEAAYNRFVSEQRAINERLAKEFLTGDWCTYDEFGNIVPLYNIDNVGTDEGQ